MGTSSSELVEILDNNDLTEHSRQHYRVRVKGQPGFVLHYEGIPLPLADVSATGASVLSKAAGELEEKQVLKGCELEIARQTFTDIRCKIMHRSIDNEGSLVCGVKWLDLSPGINERLEYLVMALRRQMFRTYNQEPGQGNGKQKI